MSLSHWIIWMALAMQAQPLTKDEVAKLAKSGVSDDVIIARMAQDQATYALSADDIAALKAAGVSDRVLQAMLARPARAPQAANLVIRNASHRAAKVGLDEVNRRLDISLTQGTDVPQNARLDLRAAAGEYRVAIEGSPTIYCVRVPEGGGAAVTIKGADTAYIDLMTAVIEDAAGTTVMILHSQGKVVEGELRRSAGYRGGPGEGFYGSRAAYLPFVSGNVLLGAGVGAIIGHQSGHRTEGALIGAGAGLLLDSFGWGARPW